MIWVLGVVEIGLLLFPIIYKNCTCHRNSHRRRPKTPTLQTVENKVKVTVNNTCSTKSEVKKVQKKFAQHSANYVSALNAHHMLKYDFNLNSTMHEFLNKMWFNAGPDGAKAGQGVLAKSHVNIRASFEVQNSELLNQYETTEVINNRFELPDKLLEELCKKSSKMTANGTPPKTVESAKKEEPEPVLEPDFDELFDDIPDEMVPFFKERIGSVSESEDSSTGYHYKGQNRRETIITLLSEISRKNACAETIKCEADDNCKENGGGGTSGGSQNDKMAEFRQMLESKMYRGRSVSYNNNMPEHSAFMIEMQTMTSSTSTRERTNSVFTPYLEVPAICDGLQSRDSSNQSRDQMQSNQSLSTKLPVNALIRRLSRQSSKDFRNSAHLLNPADGEAYLFYGTQLKNVSDIIEQGFIIDESQTGSNQPSLSFWENGHAAETHVDSQHDKCLAMFVVRVRLGRVKLKDGDFGASAVSLSDCDTLITDGEDGTRKYQKSKVIQCYPQYLVVYDKV